VNDFAACLTMGLEPVGFVQGFSVMQWQWYGAGGLGGFPPQGTGGYSETYPCPHTMVSAEHRSWGQNYEQPWIQDAWASGFGAAYRRLLEEATASGAQGVVGVVDTAEPLSDLGLVEFRIQGTGVRVADSPDPHGGIPWTTYLAGQRLAKLVEAGFAPVAVAAALASVRVWANCITGYLTEGAGAGMTSAFGVREIEQTSRAHGAVRDLARRRVLALLGSDSLHAASLSVTEREFGEGDVELQCTIRGNRVRRFDRSTTLPSPRPVVRLS
jgi:hypothetical protein